MHMGWGCRKGGREDLMAVDVRSSFVEVTTTVAHAKVRGLTPEYMTWVLLWLCGGNTG